MFQSMNCLPCYPWVGRGPGNQLFCRFWKLHPFQQGVCQACSQPALGAGRQCREPPTLTMPDLFSPKWGILWELVREKKGKKWVLEAGASAPLPNGRPYLPGNGYLVGTVSWNCLSTCSKEVKETAGQRRDSILWSIKLNTNTQFPGYIQLGFHTWLNRYSNEASKVWQRHFITYHYFLFVEYSEYWCS